MTGPLHAGGGAYVPKEVAVCPECGGELTARAMSWVTESGTPIAADIEIECLNDMNELDVGDCSHRWHQSDWQPVMDAIAQWAGAIK